MEMAAVLRKTSSGERSGSDSSDASTAPAAPAVMPASREHASEGGREGAVSTRSSWRPPPPAPPPLRGRGESQAASVDAYSPLPRRRGRGRSFDHNERT